MPEAIIDTVPPAPGSIGDELDGLLAALARAQLKIGPRERIAAHTLVAELIALGRVAALVDLRAALRPLLARSAEERDTYDGVFGALISQYSENCQENESEKLGKKNICNNKILPCSIIFMIFFIVIIFPNPINYVDDQAFINALEVIEVQQYALENYNRTVEEIARRSSLMRAEDPPLTHEQQLDRIAKAAGQFGGAPTLEELARVLVPSEYEPPLLRLPSSTPSAGELAALEALSIASAGKIAGNPEILDPGNASILQELAKAQQASKIGEEPVATVQFPPPLENPAAPDNSKASDKPSSKVKPPYIGWPAQSYAVKLSEWTGLPLSWPIAVFGVASADDKGADDKEADGRVWAQLALALARIEQPGREPAYSELIKAAQKSLKAREPDQIPRTSRLAAAFQEMLEGHPGGFASRDKLFAAADIVALEHKLASPIVADRYYLPRALAVTPGFIPPADFVKDAPWLPPRPPAEAVYAPIWTPVVALLFPFGFAVFWLANSLTIRKAYLRRRPPNLPPLHMDIVSKIRRRISEKNQTLARLAHRLLIRTPEITDRIDIGGTITATLRQGLHHITPVYQRLYRAPEYLVLIERQAAGDQETERLRMLTHRLSDMVPVTIFTFRGDPAVLEPELIGGRPQPLEQVIAAHGGHRLVVLGTGVGFLDPVTLQPRPAARLLEQFQHRALLTPVPLVEWGREEIALAQELRFPVGRATEQGMLHLAELLGVTSNEERELLDTRGDGLARALPERLRVHPERFFYSAPPSGVEVPQLLRELRNFLDPPGFEWLCALAVYPAVQWDLTLFLGATLAETPKGTPDEDPLYREDRIAALTQLPWLREGTMPVWLRRALIAELGRAGRADEVRDALKGLIEEAKRKGEQRSDNDAVLRVGREQPIEGFDPNRLYDDEVLLDFMARGRVEDFALPRRSVLEALFPRGLLERIGLPGLVAGIVALVYAGAAWWVAPKVDGQPWGLWGAEVHALVTGAWLPLELLALGGIAALALAEPEVTRSLLRSLTRRLAVPSAGFAAAAAVDAVMSIPPGNSPGAVLTGTTPGIAAILILGGIPAILIMARNYCESCYIFLPDHRPRSIRILYLAGAALGVAGALAAAELSAEPLTGWGRAGFFALLAIVAAVPIISLSVGARWGTPSPDVHPAKAKLLRPSLRAALAIGLVAPALVAAYLIQGTSVYLGTISPGSGVVAETSDGRYMAIADRDGRVQVFDTESNAKVGTIETHIGPIASLAIAATDNGHPQQRLVVAAGGANGQTVVRPVGDTSLPDRYAWVKKGESHSIGQAPLAAYGKHAHLLLGIEKPHKAAVFIAGDTPNQRLEVGDHGVLTALTALDDDYFAAATMDGGVFTVKLTESKPLLPFPPAAWLRLDDSRARHLTYDPGKRLLTVLADDGTVITAEVTREGELKEANRSSDYWTVGGLGPRVPWKRRSQAPPNPSGGAAQTPALNSTPDQGKGDALNPLQGTAAQSSNCGDGVLLSTNTAPPKCLRPGDTFRECANCPEMVLIPRGDFVMGSPDNEEGRAKDEGPQQRVAMNYDFAAGRFEVSFAEWDACVAESGCNGYRPDDNGFGRGRHPVINVSWKDVQQYLQWLSKKSGAQYRLLSEAEWEYVARAGTTTPFWWGKAIAPENANYDRNIADRSKSRTNTRNQPMEVGTYPPNLFGLFDTAGNVWEWVEDCWHENYIGAPINGSAWTESKCGLHVLRGGFWYGNPKGLRSAFRGRTEPTARADNVGFRAARRLPGLKPSSSVPASSSG